MVATPWKEKIYIFTILNVLITVTNILMQWIEDNHIIWIFKNMQSYLLEILEYISPSLMKLLPLTYIQRWKIK